MQLLSCGTIIVLSILIIGCVDPTSYDETDPGYMYHGANSSVNFTSIGDTNYLEYIDQFISELSKNITVEFDSDVNIVWIHESNRTTYIQGALHYHNYTNHIESRIFGYYVGGDRYKPYNTMSKCQANITEEYSQDLSLLRYHVRVILNGIKEIYHHDTQIEDEQFWKVFTG